MPIKKDIRKNFRDSVFRRDCYTCKYCGVGPYYLNTEEHLDAHHITDRSNIPNGGYVKENGISLCKNSCHMKAEKFHMTDGVEWETNMHPDDLYKLIGSSKVEATQTSKKLK